mmetsp:Transcript_4677/g.14824  ORF Transcript_4677/g.14824 Transcript_4677/m.14824 type:complete len:452 (+) Transcript_4677:201-1556(+)
MPLEPAWSWSCCADWDRRPVEPPLVLFLRSADDGRSRLATSFISLEAFAPEDLAASMTARRPSFCILIWRAFCLRVCTRASLRSIISPVRRSASWILRRYSRRRYSPMRRMRSTFSSFIWARRCCFARETSWSRPRASLTRRTFSSSSSKRPRRSSLRCSSSRFAWFSTMTRRCSCSSPWCAVSARSRASASRCVCRSASWCASFSKKWSLRFASTRAAWAMLRSMRASICTRRSSRRCRSSSRLRATSAWRSRSASSMSSMRRLTAACWPASMRCVARRCSSALRSRSSSRARASRLSCTALRSPSRRNWRSRSNSSRAPAWRRSSSASSAAARCSSLRRPSSAAALARRAAARFCFSSLSRSDAARLSFSACTSCIFTSKEIICWSSLSCFCFILPMRRCSSSTNAAFCRACSAMICCGVMRAPPPPPPPADRDLGDLDEDESPDLVGV